MKIGIDIRLIGKKRTGDEVVVFNLVRNLAIIDDQNEYVLFTDNQDREELAQIANQLGIAEQKNFKLVSLPTGNRFSWNFCTLPLYLKNHPVDVYHTQYITPWFVSKDIKIVTIMHDISFNFFPQFIKLSDLLFLKTLIPLSIKRADKIVGVSQFTKDEINNYYHVDPTKVDWIHNAIDDNFANRKFSADELEVVRQKYNLPVKFILYMGTLQPRKNIPHLIEAFARIKDKLTDTKLVICGSRTGHNYDQRITQALERLPIAGDVIFPGFVAEEDKAAIFQLAHAFIFPSLYEGFGIPLLEAMSQGVPVLASNIPSLKEIGQEACLFFQVDSVDDFAKKLYSICSDQSLRAELIQAGKKRISFFSWEKSARKMLAIYENLKHN